MNFNIPSRGFSFTLASDWTFILRVYPENSKFWEFAVDPIVRAEKTKEFEAGRTDFDSKIEKLPKEIHKEWQRYCEDNQHLSFWKRSEYFWKIAEPFVGTCPLEIEMPFTLAAGSILTVEKVDNRKNKEPVSVGFRLKHWKGKDVKKITFEVSLEDANALVFWCWRKDRPRFTNLYYDRGYAV